MFPPFRPNVIRLKHNHSLMESVVRENLHKTLTKTHFRYVGKKRNTQTLHDVYETNERDKLVWVATDRQTAFENRTIAGVPFKGQAINMISQWWFEQTQDLVDNVMISTPDPRVNITEKVDSLSFDLNVRRYQGDSVLVLPIPRWGNRWVSEHMLIRNGMITSSEWTQLHDLAVQLFEFGKQEVSKRGLMMVETRYRFGRNRKHSNSFVLTGGEFHTPGNTTYWLQDTYDSNLQNGLLPDHVDTDFVRLWVSKNRDKKLQVPDKLVCELSMRYISLYETITGNPFVPYVTNHDDLEQTILEALY